MARPERSDAHLPPEEARRIEDEARRYFEEMKPKRHPKPARSDPLVNDIFAGDLELSGTDPSPPELEKLRELNAEPQRLICEGGDVVDDDYVETDYYAGLQEIDKQHHTTGTGFIKIEKPEPSVSDLNLKPISTGVSRACCRWNPATNDWVPSVDQVIPVSRKPSRSDS